MPLPLTADTVFADGPSAMPSQPQKAMIRRLLRGYEDVLNAGLSNGGLVYDTKTNLDADLDHDANASAWVVEDGDNNGIYRKSGASGTGSWSKVSDLPFSVAYAQNAGTGTANAIEATSGLPIITTAYAQLISVPFTAANTSSMTLSINGETPRAMVTNTGAEIASGYIKAGMSALVQIDSDGNYRLFSYGDASAVQAAAEAAQAAAEAAAAALVKARDTVASLLADDVLSYSAGPGKTVVAVGQIIEAGGFRYEVAASDAVVYHLETAGGLKLYLITDVAPLNVRATGVKGDGSDEHALIKKAWDYCLPLGRDMYFPAGEYNCGEDNFPFKSADLPASELLDCKGITIFGDGPSTVLRTDSTDGADVLNCYFTKNLHFRNFAVKATIAEKKNFGSNGISIISAFDNVTFDHIWIEDLPYIEVYTFTVSSGTPVVGEEYTVNGSTYYCKSVSGSSMYATRIDGDTLPPSSGTLDGDADVDYSAYTFYNDGGKCFTVQPNYTTDRCGTLKAANIFCRRSIVAVDLGVQNEVWQDQPASVDINFVAEDCYTAFGLSAPAAASAVRAGVTSGIRVVGTAINCQRDVFLNRAHGIAADINVVTTKTAAARKLNPDEREWDLRDDTVQGLLCTYAKDSVVVMRGDKGECDYAFSIGGTSPGSSGLNGATSGCQFDLSMTSDASIETLHPVTFSGATVEKSAIRLSSAAFSGAIPTVLLAYAADNEILWSNRQRLNNPDVKGAVSFCNNTGATSSHSLGRRTSKNGLWFKQTEGSGGALMVMGVESHTGDTKFAVRDDGGLMVGTSPATSVTTVNGVVSIFDETGTLVGYLPLYESKT